MNNKRPYFGEMTAITLPGVVVVISPNPNFQVPGLIKPKSPVL